jgi:hypothetical protein
MLQMNSVAVSKWKGLGNYFWNTSVSKGTRAIESPNFHHSPRISQNTNYCPCVHEPIWTPTQINIEWKSHIGSNTKCRRVKLFGNAIVRHFLKGAWGLQCDPCKSSIRFKEAALKNNCNVVSSRWYRVNQEWRNFFKSQNGLIADREQFFVVLENLANHEKDVSSHSESKRSEEGHKHVTRIGLYEEMQEALANIRDVLVAISTQGRWKTLNSDFQCTWSLLIHSKMTPTKKILSPKSRRCKMDVIKDLRKSHHVTYASMILQPCADFKTMSVPKSGRCEIENGRKMVWCISGQESICCQKVPDSHYLAMW